MNKSEKLKSDLKTFLQNPIEGDNKKIENIIENELTIKELEQSIGFLQSLNSSGNKHFIVDIKISEDAINISTHCGINIVREKA